METHDKDAYVPQKEQKGAWEVKNNHHRSNHPSHPKEQRYQGGVRGRIAAHMVVCCISHWSVKKTEGIQHRSKTPATPETRKYRHTPALTPKPSMISHPKKRAGNEVHTGAKPEHRSMNHTLRYFGTIISHNVQSWQVIIVNDYIPIA